TEPCRGGASPPDRHVAVGEQTEQWRILIGLGDCAQFGGRADQVESAFLGLNLQRPACVRTRRRRLSERIRAAAERHVRANRQELFGDRALTAVLNRVGGALLGGFDRAVALSAGYV